MESHSIEHFYSSHQGHIKPEPINFSTIPLLLLITANDFPFNIPIKIIFSVEKTQQVELSDPKMWIVGIKH